MALSQLDKAVSEAGSCPSGGTGLGTSSKCSASGGDVVWLMSSGHLLDPALFHEVSPSSYAFCSIVLKEMVAVGFPVSVVVSSPPFKR